jgi:hypothetical protein
MTLWCARSAGTLGSPGAPGRPARRTAGGGWAANWRATTRASGGGPKRMQTSNASSVSGGGSAVSCSCTSTCGYACGHEARHHGATWLRPKPRVAFTRSRPAGRRARRPCNSSRSSMSARMRRACSRYSSPSTVRLIRRVVRFSSVTPRRDSICASRLLTAGGVTPARAPRPTGCRNAQQDRKEAMSSGRGCRLIGELEVNNGLTSGHSFRRQSPTWPPSHQHRP